VDITEYPYTLNYLFDIPEVYHHCTLENFDFSHQKPELKKMLEDFIEGAGGSRHGLYLYGKYGTGKTHIQVGLYRILVAMYEDISDIVFTSFSGLVNEQKNLENADEYLEILCTTKWLFLDDITEMNKKLADLSKETLRTIVTTRYENTLPTCFSANSSPKNLQKLDVNPHVISRIQGMCQVYELQGHDRREKVGN
jgi:DNA replication protein DnaC